jgi:non-specific serine/threonine protein kinase/serine/threonine-protein kinase
MPDDTPTQAHPSPVPQAPQGGLSPEVLSRSTPRAARMPGPGDVIGPYRIRSILGEGGFGVVYLADQERPIARRVALKLIKPGMDTVGVLARFEAERQALALMDHPGIAKVLDAGQTDDGRPYFVLEHVQGVSVTEFCDRERRGIEDRLRLFTQICHAVQHAHQKGIIHRDLKPSNILVGHADDGPRARIIDFGIAKALHRRLTEQSVFTEIGQLLGTPEYMSPEQAEMTALDVDTRADVYSLGVVLYELLTGALPFDPRTLRRAGYAEIQRIIREQTPPKPSTRLETIIADPRTPELAQRIADMRKSDRRTLTRKIRGELDWVVMRCLEKERERRYPSASDLAAEIDRVLTGQAVLAGPPSAAYRASRFVRRHRVGVAASALVLAALVGAVVVSTLFGLSEARARRAAVAAQTETAGVNAFLVGDLLGSADPDNDTPALRVVDLLDRGAAAAPARFTDYPDTLTRVRAMLGQAYVGVGAPERALDLLEQAIAGLPPGQTLERARLRVVRAEALWRREEAADAIPEIDAAIAELRSVLPAESAEVLNAEHQRANALKYLDRFDESQAAYDRVLSARTRVLGSTHPDTLITRYNLALLTIRRGTAARAQAGDDAAAIARARDLWHKGAAEMRAALDATRAALGEHEQVSWCLAELGSVYNRLGDPESLDRAAPLYTEALQGLRAAVGDDHWRTKQTLVNLARLQMKRGQTAEAERLYREALAAYRLSPGPTASETIMITNRFCELLRMMHKDDEATDRITRVYDELTDAARDEDDATARTDLVGRARAQAQKVAEHFRELERPDEAAAWDARAQTTSP